MFCHLKPANKGHLKHYVVIYDLPKGAPGFQKSPGVDSLKIYRFGIYHNMSVQMSIPCVVLLLSTPVKPYMHALCVHRAHNAPSLGCRDS